MLSLMPHLVRSQTVPVGAKQPGFEPLAEAFRSQLYSSPRARRGSLHICSLHIQGRGGQPPDVRGLNRRAGAWFRSTVAVCRVTDVSHTRGTRRIREDTRGHLLSAPLLGRVPADDGGVEW